MVNWRRVQSVCRILWLDHREPPDGVADSPRAAHSGSRVRRRFEGTPMETIGGPNRTALDTLAVQVAQLREEVRRMAKELDAVLVWERYCPMCGRGLRRESISEVTQCACGWVWE